MTKQEIKDRLIFDKTRRLPQSNDRKFFRLILSFNDIGVLDKLDKYDSFRSNYYFKDKV